MDEDTLNQFLAITRVLRMRIYSIQMPQAVILDLDPTLLDAYGRQEGRAFNFNFHYQSNGYHPLVCYDGMTGDLIKIQLRDGTQYSCTGELIFCSRYWTFIQQDITFRLCSSCPYKNEFYETLSNIGISAFYFSSSVNFALLFSIIINFLSYNCNNCVISAALMLYQMTQNPPTLPCNKTNFYKPIELRST